MIGRKPSLNGSGDNVMTVTTEGTRIPLRSEAHEDYLTGHAILPAVLDAARVCSEGDRIIFPWKDGELETPQTRQWPEDENTFALGKKSRAKYLWMKDKPLHLWAIRSVTGQTKTVLIVEGTKQALAVASWA